MKNSPSITISPARNPTNHSPFRRGFFLIALACFAVSPIAQAVSPSPDGGYPNFTTAEGQNALLHLTNGSANTALGSFSLENVTTSSFCTGVGAGTLLLNTADENTASGAAALLSNTVGFENTANGAFALFSNTTGNRNNAFGSSALFLHATGSFNNAVGSFSLYSDTGGESNNAFGDQALFSNTNGSVNTAIGDGALLSNTTGSGNVAVGVQALASSTVAGIDTQDGASVAVGYRALQSANGTGVSSGGGNNALGQEALGNNTTGFFNNAFGAGALPNVTSGNYNTAIGHRAGEGLTTGIGNVYIGAAAQPSNEAESNTTRIRNIYDSVVTDRVVYVNSEGKLGTLASSRRFKEHIKPMDASSEPLFSLKPVTFRYKKQIDSSRAPQFGLVAEEVAKVSPDLVVRDRQDQVYSVRYEAVNVMLLNEFLKEHRRVGQLQASITQLNSIVAKQEAIIAEEQRTSQTTAARQQEEINVLTASLKEQASQIQRVSARLEVSTSGSQITYSLGNPSNPTNEKTTNYKTHVSE
jgi:trimeric autotransporter adhesin